MKALLCLTLILLSILQVTWGQDCPDRDESLLEEGRSCKNSCTNSSSCKIRKQCICDNVCGLSCINPNAKCNPLPPLEHGSIDGVLTYGRTIRYRCDEGYILNGTSRRTCRSDRKWTGNEPTCLSGCLNPRSTQQYFPDALKNDYFVGESLDFLCRFGYEISGPSRVTCLGNNVWSQIEFVCVPVQCGEPPKISNGYFEGSDFSFGKRVTYFCNRGYELIGRQRFLSCNTEGDWRGTVPECEPIECAVPLAPANGFVDTRGVDAFTFNVQIRYSCANGYALNGNERARCHINATWGDVPTCVVDRNCNFENAQEPLCSYTLVGEGWRRAFSRKVAKGSRGYVLEARFQSEQTNRRTTLKSQAISTGERLCLSFYYRLHSLRSGSDFVLQVTQTGGLSRNAWIANPRDQKDTWLSTDYALPRDGGDFEILFTVEKNSRLDTEVDIDDVKISNTDDCENECNPDPCENGGTCLNRVGKYDCLCPEGYSGQVCSIVAECDVPEPSPHDTVFPSTPKVRFNRRVVYTCKNGFEFDVGVTEISVLCKSDETWERPRPICRRIQCIVPNLPSNVLRSTARPTLSVGETFTYTCGPGPYTMTDQPSEKLTVTCQSDGSWSSPAPTCREREKVCVENGNLCHFPFTYAHVTYDSCTTVENGNTPWCAYDAVFRSMRWDDCRHCPASWSEWQQWSGCSVSCGIGNRERNRRCIRGEAGSHYCPGLSVQVQECDLVPCIVGDVGDYKSVEIGSSLYAIFLQALTRNGALRHCEAFGGSLAKIPSFEVNRRLFAEIRKLPRNPNQGSPSFHIGMNDIEREGFWYWPDGSPIINNWAHREPNNGGGIHGKEDCGVIVRQNGRWNDVSCNRRDYFICQKGVLGEWSNWGSCSRTCGNGQQTRQKSCGGFTPGSRTFRTYCRNETSQTRVCSNSVGCNHETIEVNGNVYTFVRDQETFSEAKSYCQVLGGDLAVIKTPGIQLRLYAKIQNINEQAGRPFPYFIGMTSFNLPEWRWSDGSRVPLRNEQGYQNWDIGQPQNTVEHCGTLYWDDGKWHDSSCNKEYPSVCQHRFDPCQAEPCMNNGTCAARGRTRICACPRYIAGDDCEMIESLCYSSPCLNGGRCRGDQESYTCQCDETSWRGQNCEEAVIGCIFNERRLSSEVKIEGLTEGQYDAGSSFQVGCKDSSQHLNTAFTNLTCREEGNWFPDYTLYQCT